MSEQTKLKSFLAPFRLSHSEPSVPQNKYKEEGKKEMSTSLYSQLPETAEMQLAKTVQEFQSEVQQQEVYSDFYQASFCSSLHQNFWY